MVESDNTVGENIALKNPNIRERNLSPAEIENYKLIDEVFGEYTWNGIAFSYFNSILLLKILARSLPYSETGTYVVNIPILSRPYSPTEEPAPMHYTIHSLAAKVLNTTRRFYPRPRKINLFSLKKSHVSERGIINVVAGY